MQKQDELLTVGEVAKRLRIGQRTVYRWADRGRIPRPLKLGALVRWRQSEIEEWIAAGCPASRR